jgi:hypothetical protein
MCRRPPGTSGSAPQLSQLLVPILAQVALSHVFQVGDQVVEVLIGQDLLRKRAHL